MLKLLTKVWRQGGLMRHALEVLAQMLDDAEYVFTHSWEACIGQAVLSETAKPIRQHDKSVNRGEREIRRILVEHLTVNPKDDVAGCLALMAMAKDTERVGDHGGNIYGIAVMTEGKLRDYRYFEQIDAVQKSIAPIFRKLHDADLQSDGELTHQVLDEYQGVKDLLKPLQKVVLDDGGLPAREAMTTILLVRYLKRVNAHLGNIASGIIFPVENIDFVSRGLRQEREQGWAKPAPDADDQTAKQAGDG